MNTNPRIIKNEFLKVKISPIGAEIISVIDSSGRERIWQGDPAYWSQHAPILFPICGGLKNGGYYLNGKLYKMEKHGFAMKRSWEAIKHASDDSKERITFLLKENHPGFPFKYNLFATYQLKENSLIVRYKVDNLDTVPFAYSIGAHEGFALESKLEDYSLVIDSPENIYCSHQIGNLVIPEEKLVWENTEIIKLHPDLFKDGALILRSLKSKTIRLRDASDEIKLTVERCNMNVAIVWTIPGAGYLCIESWTCCPDFTDTDMMIENKPGVTILKPGESDTRTHVITFS